MNETQITFSGWVGTDVTVSETRSGPVATFRVGSTPRRLVGGVWQDLPTNWFTVKAWRGLAENVAASVRRGDAVVVTGRFTADVWEREGERSVRSTVVATSIGALIAAKVAMAVLASRFLPALESRGYLLAMKFLAATMAGFGLLSIARAAELGLSGALDF